MVGNPVSSDQWSALADRLDASFTERPSYVTAAAALPIGGRRLPGSSTAIAAVVDGGGPRAILGMRVLGVGRLRIASHAGHRLGCSGDALVDSPEAARALLDLLRRNRLALKFDRIPTHSTFLEALRRDRGWRVDEQVVDESPVLTLPPGATARDIRSGRSLKRLRTALRAAERDHGHVEFVTVSTPEDLEARWPDLRRVSAARTASMSGRIDYLAGPLAPLVESTLAQEARAGRLVITGMVVGNVWMAHEVSLRSGRTLHSWLSHFDPQIAAAQPGHQILAQLADKHEGLGFDRLDHGVGVNGIKQAWSGADSYPVSRVRAVATGPRGRVLSAAMRSRDFLRARGNPDPRGPIPVTGPQRQDSSAGNGS